MEVKGDIALVSLIDSFEFRIKSLYPHSFSLPEVNWVSVVDLLKDGVAHMRLWFLKLKCSPVASSRFLLMT